MARPDRPPAHPALDRIKRETLGAHRSLERQVPLMARDLTLDAYRAWCLTMLGFHEPLEARLEPWGDGLLSDWPKRRKIPRLHADLADLGLSEDAIAAAPRCDDLPAIDGPGQAFGAMYVVEGSSLGGRVISKHLRARLDVGPHRGARFFAPYGEDPMPRWQAFREAFAARVEGPDLDAAIDTANATFAALERWATQRQAALQR